MSIDFSSLRAAFTADLLLEANPTSIQPGTAEDVALWALIDRAESIQLALRSGYEVSTRDREFLDILKGVIGKKGVTPEEESFLLQFVPRADRKPDLDRVAFEVWRLMDTYKKGAPGRERTAQERALAGNKASRSTWGRWANSSHGSRISTGAGLRGQVVPNR